MSGSKNSDRQVQDDIGRAAETEGARLGDKQMEAEGLAAQSDARDDTKDVSEGVRDS